jgi:hypothetical protein
MLVVGIPLGLLLTGVVWQLVGACDTVLLQQLLRFSADETAFETAIWHARGMNLIAVINLTMQALSVIWLTWHILAGTIPVAAIPCDTQSVCDGKSTQDGYDLATKMTNAEPQVENWVSSQMQSLSKLEVITSAVTPVIALTQATQTGAATPDNWLSFTVPFSGSLVPDANLPGLLQMSASNLSGYPRMTYSADTPSLPVQANDEKVVCQNVADLVPDIADKVMPRVDASWIKPSFASMKYDWKQAYISLAKGLPCLGIKKKAKVAGVWEFAKYRSDHAHEYAFQIYGFGFGKTDKVNKDDEFVRVPAPGSAPLNLKSNWTASQAEFYCDCGGQDWSKCADTAMMAPNWTARLRRVRVPDKSQVTGLFSYVVLPPSYASHLDSASNSLFSNNATDVWDRVSKLMH